MGAIGPILSLYTISLGPLYHKILRPPLVYKCASVEGIVPEKSSRANLNETGAVKN